MTIVLRQAIVPVEDKNYLYVRFVYGFVKLTLVARWNHVTHETWNHPQKNIPPMPKNVLVQ